MAIKGTTRLESGISAVTFCSGGTASQSAAGSRPSCKSDTETIPKILERERPRFVAYVCKRTSSIDAEDIVHSFIRKVLELLARGASPEYPMAWLYTVLRRHVIDHGRRGAARQRMNEAYAHFQAALPAGNSDSVPHAHASPCGCAKEAVEFLPTSQAAVVRLAALENHSHHVIAARLELSTQAVTVRLHRARKALRSLLADQCADCCPAHLDGCICPAEWNTTTGRKVLHRGAS